MMVNEDSEYPNRVDEWKEDMEKHPEKREEIARMLKEAEDKLAFI